MSNVTHKQLLRMLAEQSTHYVLMDSTKRAIEKMAEEFARDMQADPVFREQLRQEATRAARAIAESLRIVHEAEDAAAAAHSGRKRSPRKTKRQRPGTRTSRTS